MSLGAVGFCAAERFPQARWRTPGVSDGYSYKFDSLRIAESGGDDSAGRGFVSFVRKTAVSQRLRLYSATKGKKGKKRL